MHKMNKFNVDFIMMSNPLIEELLKYGIEVDKKGFACCPFHDEKTPSFKVYEDGTYHCFGCGAHGNVIDFTMAMLKLSFREACERLSGELKYSDIRKAKNAANLRIKKKRDIEIASLSYWKSFDRWKAVEDVIDRKKPESPGAVPDKEWLLALSERSWAGYVLDCAETKLFISRNGVNAR